jgi:GT2 family glycosyltransferase
MYKFSVVISVYGQWDLAKRNIDSLLLYEKDSLEEIIVVDDCSPEANPYVFTDSIITVLKNERNLGFASTVNKGLRHASSEYILLLDSDACLLRPITKDLRKLLFSNPSLGCVSLTAVGDHGQITGSAQTLPTLAGYIAGQAADAWLSAFQGWFTHKRIPFSCCLVFNKKCLQDVNYFDEVTFPQVESDVDLSLRIYQSGWKIQLSKDIVIFHQGGNSFKVNTKRVRMYHEAKWKLLRRHQTIRFPELMKFALSARIRIEIALMATLLVIRSEETILNEKLLGRRELLKDIKRYV